MDDVYTVTTDAFPTAPRVVSFRGVETISKPYRFELFVQLAADDAKSLVLADVVGKTATLAIHADRTEGLKFHGILTTVEMLHAHMGFALFRAVLEPRLVRLKHSFHSRIFTNQSIPDIITAVLQENGLAGSDFALQLTGSYAPEEHVCEYHETDFDFVSRWLEHLGMYYFFDHTGEQEKLVIADDKSAHTDLPTAAVRYFPSAFGDTSSAPAMETFRCKASALPASVKLKDYDYTKPALDVSASAPVASNGVGEIAVYGARFFTPSDAQSFAKLRAEEMLARQLEHPGSSTILLRAGYQFTLDEHPIDSLNVKYLATEVEHHGNLVGDSPDLQRRIEIAYPDVYRCNVTAIPQKTQFRPARVTAWPRIYGLENGVIDGAADSDYAQIDDHGRYCVKFLFDESPLKDGKASTWVRMMQPHGGGIEGFHFPLRKGTEVVLSFLGGDPDRPVIAGVVNNTTTPSPITSGNNTRNVIQTGGRNRLEIEDKEGQERVSFSSPHKNSYIRFGAPNDSAEMHLNTDGSGIVHTKGNLTVNVDTDLTEMILGTTHQTYSKPQTISTTATRDDTVTGLVHEIFTSGHTLEVTGARQITTTGALTDHVTTVTTQNYDGAHLLTTGARTDHVKGTLNQEVDGAVTIKAPSVTFNVVGGVTNNVSSQILTTVNGHNVINSGANMTMTTGATFSLAASASLAIAASASLSITGGINLSAFAGLSVSATAGASASFAGATDLRASTTTNQNSAAHNINTGDLIVIAAMIELNAAAQTFKGAVIMIG